MKKIKVRHYILFSVLFVWGIIILGCAGTHPPVRGEADPSVSQNLLQRCSQPVLSIRCSGGSSIYRTICARQVSDEYYALQSLAERRDYLMANGCPESMASR